MKSQPWEKKTPQLKIEIDWAGLIGALVVSIAVLGLVLSPANNGPDHIDFCQSQGGDYYMHSWGVPDDCILEENGAKVRYGIGWNRNEGYYLIPGSGGMR